MEPQDVLNRIKDLARQDPTLLNDATGEQVAHLLAFVLREMRPDRRTAPVPENAPEEGEGASETPPPPTVEEILTLLRQEQAVRRAALPPGRDAEKNPLWNPGGSSAAFRVAALEDAWRDLRAQTARSLSDLRQEGQQALQTQEAQFSQKLSDLRREAAGQHLATLSRFAAWETRLEEGARQELRLQELVAEQRNALDALTALVAEEGKALRREMRQGTPSKEHRRKDAPLRPDAWVSSLQSVEAALHAMETRLERHLEDLSAHPAAVPPAPVIRSDPPPSGESPEGRPAVPSVAPLETGGESADLRTLFQELRRELRDTQVLVARYHTRLTQELAAWRQSMEDLEQRLERHGETLSSELSAVRHEEERHRQEDRQRQGEAEENLRGALAALDARLEELRRAAPPGAIGWIGGEKTPPAQP